ncbi:hypothetical protein [Streptomyces sp. H27-D2]|uniref:hypothetical protein n=1 Tax=Streptomyces sp. H27-D2 TaxID=3046304 RepID=UPI002DB844AC|nr:hypothetical protein [Streptomyces sp. H27-D2]MEC4014940.1 hypothetical protein [Streptomyces sp. H27-D2]
MFDPNDPEDVRKPQDSADSAAEAVRTFNHATLPTARSRSGSLHYPGQAYTSVAGFKQMAQSLPQSFEQTSGFLTRQHLDGTLTADYGLVADHVSAATTALAEASRCADLLADALNRAHSALSPLGYSGETEA